MKPLILFASAVLAAGLAGGLLVAADVPKVVAPSTPPRATPPPKTPVAVSTPVRVQAAAPVVANFDAFRLIGDRNIFNPNRTGRRMPGSDEPAPKMDVIAFVGTMDYEKGLLAFFDSPDGTFRKVLREGQTIAQFTVKNITANSVDLVRDPKPFSMKVGMQLRKPVGGDWSLIAADVVREEARAAEAASTTAATAMPVIPPDASEALKRLMEKRQNQLKQ
jgi:hypothetical protein